MKYFFIVFFNNSEYFFNNYEKTKNVEITFFESEYIVITFVIGNNQNPIILFLKLKNALL